uniref:Glutamate--ammonia ligase n=1 Tax=Tanacetum cinerariifolium TaxID=118510 RepID=A0A6L2JPR2_TANCI|nr:glutamine synthetase [Tanacetum cinerariifolium]
MMLSIARGTCTNEIMIRKRYVSAVTTRSGTSSEERMQQRELEANAREQAREREWQQRIIDINSVLKKFTDSRPPSYFTPLWEFHVEPSLGIASGDELWAARYILEVDSNGVGAHTNYNTKTMREEGGYEIIKNAIEKLGLRHKEHIAAYGEGNERRPTGRHETADINTFKWRMDFSGYGILNLVSSWSLVKCRLKYIVSFLMDTTYRMPEQ